MPVCTGGSQPQAGAPAAILVTIDQLANYLPPGSDWIRPLLPYLQPILLSDISDFCSTDPPGYPNLSGLAFDAVFAGGEFGAAAVAIFAIQQIMRTVVWYRVCECVTGGVQPVPAGPSDPGTVPAVNPPGAALPPNAVPCGTASGGPSGTVINTFQPCLSTTDVPLNSHIVQLSLHVTPTGATHHSIDFYYATYGTGIATPLSLGFTTVASGATTVVTVVIPPGATIMDVKLTTGPNVNTDLGSVTASFYCGADIPTAPPPVAQPLPPVDRAMLDRILAMVTLIQRQAVPFGYVYGTNHTGLTGHGSFSVADLIGVSVDVTTLPGWAGAADGSPTQYFDLGFVTLGTADGYEHSRRIDHDGTLFLPYAAGAFTAVGYTLASGVEVAIRELVREP